MNDTTTTTTDLSWLTPRYVNTAIRGIAAEHPDRTNPRDSDYWSCLYTDLDDPHWHCLIGQFLANLGVEMLDVDDRLDASSVVAKHGSAFLSDVLDMVDSYQADADSCDRWGEVVTRLSMVTPFSVD